MVIIYYSITMYTLYFGVPNYYNTYNVDAIVLLQTIYIINILLYIF